MPVKLAADVLLLVGPATIYRQTFIVNWYVVHGRCGYAESTSRFMHLHTDSTE